MPCNMMIKMFKKKIARTQIVEKLRNSSKETNVQQQDISPRAQKARKTISHKPMSDGKVFLLYN